MTLSPYEVDESNSEAFPAFRDDVLQEPPAGIAEIYRPTPIMQLVQTYPTLRPPVIDGLIREGETAGIHAKSKVGKSWLSYLIGLNVASGYHLFGRYKCTPGRVLLIDYELHPENLANRVPAVAQAMHLRPDDYANSFDVLSMRGRIKSLADMSPVLDALDQNAYKLVILDPLYRILPGGISENDNAAMATVFNMIDTYAAQMHAAFLFIHHQSKGSQNEKDVVDVGSGAGSIARAVDSHIVLRPHEETGHVVMDAALRSFAPIEPTVLRWEFPLWRLAEGMDPAALKGRKSAGEERQGERDKDGIEKILKAIPDGETVCRKQIRTSTGIGYDRLNKLIRELIDSERIQISETTTAKNGNSVDWFSKLTV